MKPVELAFAKGYRCTPEGSVISPKGRVLKLRNHSKGGYPYFGVAIGGKKKVTVRAHRLQAFQKFGAAMFEPGIEVRHLDGNPANFAEANLALGTKSENQQDKSKETRIRVATIASKAVTKHDHAAVIAGYQSNGFSATLSMFGIGKGTLSYILRKSATAKQLEAA